MDRLLAFGAFGKTERIVGSGFRAAPGTYWVRKWGSDSRLQLNGHQTDGFGFLGDEEMAYGAGDLDLYLVGS